MYVGVFLKPAKISKLDVLLADTEYEDQELRLFLADFD